MLGHSSSNPSSPEAIMTLHPSPVVAPSEITPASAYYGRRRFLGAAAAAAAALQQPGRVLAAPADG